MNANAKDQPAGVNLTGESRPVRTVPSGVDRWLSVEEIAAHLGVKPTSIYKWITRNGMPAHKVGRLWKFKIAEVDEWIRSGKAAQGSDA